MFFNNYSTHYSLWTSFYMKPSIQKNITIILVDRTMTTFFLLLIIILVIVYKLPKLYIILVILYLMVIIIKA